MTPKGRSLLRPWLPAIALCSAPTTIPAQSPIGIEKIAIATVAVALATTFDAPIARILAGSGASFRHSAAGFDRMGEIVVIAPVVGGLALAGWLTHRPALTRLAAQSAAALATVSVSVNALKRIIGRTRPYDDPRLSATEFSPFSNQTALPSGHTAAAFALATTLADGIDRPLPRIGLYGLAVATGFARMADAKHWFSDVLAGAAVGIAAGKLANGRWTLLGLRAPQLLVGPGTAAVTWDF